MSSSAAASDASVCCSSELLLNKLKRITRRQTPTFTASCRRNTARQYSQTHRAIHPLLLLYARPQTLKRSRVPHGHARASTVEMQRAVTQQPTSRMCGFRCQKNCSPVRAEKSVRTSLTATFRNMTLMIWPYSRPSR